MRCVAVACCIVFAICIIPDVLAQTPTVPEFLALTDRGNLIEIKPADDVPTTDIVSSPYVEFQRVGGLIASGNKISEAAQYNTVSSGVTYIINNWGEGETYGIPNWAPLGGEMRLYPKPHLYLRESAPPHWPSGIENITIQSGSIGYEFYNNGTGEEYVEFKNSGRAVIFLDGLYDHYAINTICLDCTDRARATIGVMPYWGNMLGLSTLVRPSGNCTVDSINYTGCGELYGVATSRYWPTTVPTISHTPYPGHNNAILDVTAYDTTTCPGAAHNNTEIIQLDDAYFRLQSHGCLMENYSYRWHDGNIRLFDSLPLRPGLTIYENAQTPRQAIIVVDLVGGSIKMQILMAQTAHNARAAFEHTFSVDASTVVDSNSVVVLHDAFTHLGYYTETDLHRIADHVQTYPQLTPNTTTTTVSHVGQSGASGAGGLLGADCLDAHGETDYKYCITVFDSRSLPSLNPATGRVYDPRNNAVLNGPDVRNHGNVFVTSRPTSTDNAYYDSGKLNLIQAYGVIPVTGSINVQEIYLVASMHDCARFIDDTTRPHSWNPPPGSGWLGMDYLIGEYGVDRTLINIPILPWYGKVCMRTHGVDEFRQYNMDNFFVQGAHASFGGVRHVTTIDSGLHGQARPYTTSNILIMDILDTEVVLPGSGTHVMDFDLKLSGSLLIDGVVPGGGDRYTGAKSTSCDWHRMPVTPPPRHNTAQDIRYAVLVDIEVPVAGGYQRIGGLSVSDLTPLVAAQTPITVGEDCRHVSYAEWDFAPEYRTIPIQHTSSTPILIKVQSTITFYGGMDAVYANSRPDETMHVETTIERLSVRVN